MMSSPRKPSLVQMHGQAMYLAHVLEEGNTLIITQSNAPALRDLRASIVGISGSLTSSFLVYLIFPQEVRSWLHAFSSGPAAGMLFFMVGFFLLASLLPSINRLFGKEIFVFDKNKGVFIRNGSVAAALSDIQDIKAQVTRGEGQNPMFRLVVELPGYAVPLVMTNYVPAPGDFKLSGNGFGNPNKRFAAYVPWLDYDKQNLVPFLPPEIVDLQQRIKTYLDK